MDDEEADENTAVLDPDHAMRRTRTHRIQDGSDRIKECDRGGIIEWQSQDGTQLTEPETWKT